MKKNNLERSRLLIINTSYSLFVKGGALMVSFITFPIYIKYFENQAILGFWFTALSVLSWILTFDLGIGNGLRNNLVFAFENKDMIRAKIYISSAYTIVGAFVLISSILSYFIFPYINWNKIFNTPTSLIPSNILVEVVTYVLVGIMLQFFLTLLNSIYYSIQRPALPGFLNLISSIGILIFLQLSNYESFESKIKAIAIATIFINNTPLLIASIILFTGRLKKSYPSIFYAKKLETISIIKIGGLFFGLQIMFMLITNTKEFFISWLSNPADVVEFQIYNKPFSFVSSIFYLALTPVWSAVTAAYAKNDIKWIQTLTIRLQKLSIIAIIGSFVMVFFLQYFVNIWLGKRAIHINFIYGIIYAFSSGAFIWSAVITSIVNGIGKLKTQAIFMGIGAFINFPLAFLFVKIFDSWIGIVFANFIAIIPYCVVQTLNLRIWFRNSKFSNELN